MNNKLIMLSFIVFLLSGLIVGFLIGGQIMQDKWISYYEAKDEEIEKYCICNYPETKEEFILPKLNDSFEYY